MIVDKCFSFLDRCGPSLSRFADHSDYSGRRFFPIFWRQSLCLCFKTETLTKITLAILETHYVNSLVHMHPLHCQMFARSCSLMKRIWKVEISPEHSWQADNHNHTLKSHYIPPSLDKFALYEFTCHFKCKRGVNISDHKRSGKTHTR